MTRPPDRGVAVVGGGGQRAGHPGHRVAGRESCASAGEGGEEGGGPVGISTQGVPEKFHITIGFLEEPPFIILAR